MKTIFFETLKDLFSLKRTLLYLAITFLAALIVSGIVGESGIVDESMNLGMATQLVAGIFTIFSFMMLAGIPLVIFVSASAAGFIAGEESEGTLLLLVSKPIPRHAIVLGKFLALLISSLLLEILSLMFFVVLLQISLRLDMFTFSYIVRTIPGILLYAVIIIAFFGSLATLLSVLTKSRMKIIIITVLLTIFTYFGFSIVRQFTVPSGLYKKYKINYLDLSYHLGNSFDLFLESGQDYRMAPSIQMFFGQFTGLYESLQDSFDQDLNAMPASLKPMNYNSPTLSLVLCLLFSIGSLTASLFLFRKKEVY